MIARYTPRRALPLDTPEVDALVAPENHLQAV